MAVPDFRLDSSTTSTTRPYTNISLSPTLGRGLSVPSNEHIAAVASSLKAYSTPPPPPPPDPLLPDKQLDTGNITFKDGVPVGGYAHLSVFPNGNYNFIGHYHDSGATSYNTELVFTLKDDITNTVFVFPHQGRVHGTFESGSRNDDWNTSGNNPVLTDVWKGLSKSHSSSWHAGVDLDLGGLIDSATKAVGLAQAVITLF